MSFKKECKDDNKEKNPFTNRCISKCVEDEVRVINIENKKFDCKKTSNKEKALEDLELAELELIKRNLIKFTTKQKQLMQNKASVSEEATSAREEATSAREEEAALLSIDVPKTPNFDYLKEERDEFIRDKLIKDFGIKEKTISKWNREILEKEYIKRLKKQMAAPAPVIAKAAAPAPVIAKAAAPAKEEEKEDIFEGDLDDKLTNKKNRAFELKEYEDFKKNKENDDAKYNLLYPNLNDPSFNIKITQKKEFYENQYDGQTDEDGQMLDIEKYSKILCSAEFELSPHQIFVRNFLSFQTPYNSLLLYHGLGSGKTCSAINIAEEMRDYYIQIGVLNKIFVIASQNVQNNFRLQLFDERKLKDENGIWNIRSCTGNKFLKEINPLNVKGLTRENIIQQVQQIINKYYKFMGYTEFANYITKISSIQDYSADLTPKQKKQLIKKKLQKHFDNRLIIIDEVHNIRIADDSEGKRVATELFKLVQNVNNLRLLLLSATPMYNTYKEIIWLINLMNLNDKRPTIEVKEIFDNEGNFQINKNGEESGKELLIRKATGYISFVRGENPYTFPYRLWPNEFADKKYTFKLNDASEMVRMRDEEGEMEEASAVVGSDDYQPYPTLQLNGKEIPPYQKIDKISVFLTTIGKVQEKGYKYIIDKMKKSFSEMTKKNSSFEQMDSFGFKILQKPIEALNIIYPDDRFDIVAGAEEQPPNIDERELVGKGGLARIMDFESPDKIKRFNFKYKDLTKYGGRIFSPEHIAKYSGKIATICERIMGSTGVILVYSQYIDGGVLPIALALEELGFTRGREGQNLFETPPVEPIDAFTFEAKSKYTGDKPFQGAKYVMLTGDKGFTPDSVNDIKMLTNEDNTDGSKIKVVLISQAAAEGVDLKYIRQVHILDPWYNMNRNEQIIGRAVRNCSHRNLPFLERNVEIYLYATLLINKEEEAADLYVYRLAQEKAVKMGEISRVLKEISVDCNLNSKQNNFNQINMKLKGMKEITLKLSSKKDKANIKYQIGDKPYSTTCDYMQNCSYVCLPSVNMEVMKTPNTDTYNEKYMMMSSDNIIIRIKELFKEKFFYRKDELITRINIIKTNSLEQILYALTQLIDDKYEYVTDKYDRLGHIINIDDLYLFQPLELNNTHVSMRDRSVPIDYKHDNIKVTFSEEEADATTEIFSENDIIQLLQRMKKNYETATINLTEKDAEPKPDKRGKLNWYENCRLVIKEMLDPENEVDENWVYEFLISHIIEELLYNEMLQLLNYMDSLNVEDEVEMLIKTYLENKLIKIKNLIGIVLFDDKNKRQILIKDDEIGRWKRVEKGDADENELAPKIAEIIINVQPPKEKLNEILGFMSLNINGNEMIFKIKNFANPRSTGITCGTDKNESIRTLLKILNKGKEQNEEDSKVLQGYKPLQICAKIEFYLRLKDKKLEKGKRYFLNNTEANLIGLDKLVY